MPSTSDLPDIGDSAELLSLFNSHQINPIITIVITMYLITSFLIYVRFTYITMKISYCLLFHISHAAIACPSSISSPFFTVAPLSAASFINIVSEGLYIVSNTT